MNGSRETIYKNNLARHMPVRSHACAVKMRRFSTLKPADHGFRFGCRSKRPSHSSTDHCVSLMLAYAGCGIRFNSRPQEIGYINGHDEVLLVAKSRGLALKTECLGIILPTREKKPSIYLSVYNQRCSLAGAKQFGQRWSDTA